MPFYTPFVEQKKDIDWSTLNSFKGLFQLLQVDIAGVRFLAKSTVDPKYCLLFVDLLTLKIYTYPMKSRSLLKRKTQLFYNDIAQKKK